MSLVNDMAALEFDVKTAQDVLAMFADAGKKRIRVQDQLQQCLGRIEKEFSKWMGVSRQAYYNWRENGYIIFQGKRIDLPVKLQSYIFLAKNAK